jgi:hypothetical protein
MFKFFPLSNAKLLRRNFKFQVVLSISIFYPTASESRLFHYCSKNDRKIVPMQTTSNRSPDFNILGSILHWYGYHTRFYLYAKRPEYSTSLTLRRHSTVWNTLHIQNEAILRCSIMVFYWVAIVVDQFCLQYKWFFFWNTYLCLVYAKKVNEIAWNNHDSNLNKLAWVKNFISTHRVHIYLGIHADNGTANDIECCYVSWRTSHCLHTCRLQSYSWGVTNA